MGIEVMAPDINESFEDFTMLEPGKIRFGLGAVKNVGSNVVQAILSTRGKDGKFSALPDFIERVGHKDLNKKSLESLAKCGALDQLEERGQIISNIDLLLEYNRESQKIRSSGQENLFGDAQTAKISSLRLKNFEPAGRRERLLWEKELLGLYITEHPVQEYSARLIAKHVLPLKDLSPRLVNQQVTVGGLVSGIQKIITKSGEPMLFVTLEDLTAKAEVLVFPKVLAKNPSLWHAEKILIVRGRLSDKDGVPKVLCEEAIEIT